MKLEFWERSAFAKTDCLKVQSYVYNPVLFVGFSLQE